MFEKKPKELVAAGGGTTIIGSAVTLTGDLASTADIRIDGKVKGNVNSDCRILVGAEGEIDGNLFSQQVDVMGTIHGNIKARELIVLRGNSVVTGDLMAPKIQIEPTVVFNGRCNMAKGVVEMKEKNEQPKKIALH